METISSEALCPLFLQIVNNVSLRIGWWFPLYFYCNEGIRIMQEVRFNSYEKSGNNGLKKLSLCSFKPPSIAPRLFWLS